MLLTGDPGYGDASQLAVREPDQEGSHLAGLQELLCLLAGHEAQQCPAVADYRRFQSPGYG